MTHPTSDDAQRLQEVLGDRYHVENELGRGGMSIVYAATDLRYNRRVAVKVLRSELSASVGAQRFVREIEIASQLQHPHILSLLDSGEAQGLLYYVMPYVEGESLRNRLDREGSLPIEEAVDIIREVADALGFAHSHGVVHRDIKPENILLAGNHAIVADFGVAKALQVAGGGTLTDTGMAIGTPAYMSPEQASGDKHLDGRSDIYSLACVLYEMLGGEPPFTGPTAQAIFARILQEPPPALKVIRPGIPAGLLKVVEKALSKVPADRYATAASLVEALDAYPDQKEPSRVRGRLVGAVAGVVIVIGGWIGYRVVMGSGEPALDPEHVVVFPLAEAAGPSGEGEAVAVMVGNALEQALSWSYGWNWLEADARDDPRRISGDVAQRIARARGAGFCIGGWLTHFGDSASVALNLTDTRRQSVVAQHSAAGSLKETSVAQIALRALLGLVPALLPTGREIDITPYADRDAGSIMTWLQGEREYRRSRFRVAYPLLRSAVEQDSALAIAALRAAQAASWMSRNDEARALVSHALTFQASLPPQQQLFARGLQAYFTGAGDSAVAVLNQALENDSTWSDAWMLLGEVRRHLWPVGGHLDSLAEVAFRRAARDTSYTPPAFHLFEYAVWKSRLGEAERWYGVLARATPDTTILDEVTLALRCARDGMSDAQWAAETSERSSAVLQAGLVFSVAGNHVTCAEGAFRSLLADPDVPGGRKWSTLLVYQNQLIAQGRIPEARVLLDSALKGGMAAVRYLYVLDADAGADFQVEAHAVGAYVREHFGEDYEALGPTTTWLLGVLAGFNGNLDRLQNISSALERRAARSGARRDVLISHAIAARLALDSRDTAQALQRLGSLVPNAPREDLHWDLWEALGKERLVLAELLLRAGNADRALEVADTFDYPHTVMNSLYLGNSLELRIRAASALGDEGLARRYRERLQRLQNPRTD